ncbi:hypothetical protein IAF44_19920, partial [Acinetobacter baumannii]|nr:hypothetical protein [Acinetobacter baumannii]
YWQRPELTDAQFRTLPSLPNAGRLYRTGDKVCLRTDGRLTHQGHKAECSPVVHLNQYTLHQ